MSAFISLHNSPQLPESLGKKNSANSVSVTFSSDDALSIGTVTLDSEKGAGDTSPTTLRVVIAADQATTIATSAGQLTGNTSLAAIDTKLGGTLAISAASLPLPTGAATAANQATANTSLAAIDTKLGGTLAISAAALPLPTGAASQTTLASIDTKLAGTLTVGLPTGASTAANQTTGNTSLASIDTKLGTSNTSLASIDTKAVQMALDSGAASGAVRTVLATRHEAVATPLAVQLSNGAAALAMDSGVSSSATLRAVLATRHESASTPLSVRITNGTAFSTPAVKGRSFSDSARNDYSTGNVTTAAWTQLIASTAAEINEVWITDQSGECMEIGVGAAASETRKFLVPRGFSGPVNLNIPAGSRVAIKAVSATASSGEVCITGLN